MRSEQVAEDGESDDGEQQCENKDSGCEDAGEARKTVRPDACENEYGKQRNLKNEKGIEVPCFGEVAVEQGMDGTLRPAAGAVPAGDELERAAWKPGAFSRVKNGIYGNHCRHDRRCQEDKYAAVLHGHIGAVSKE